MTDDRGLPSSIRPRAYRLALEPDLEACTFKGEVEIDLEVRPPVREIELHAAELDIAGAALGGERVEVRFDPGRERLVLVPPRPLEPGATRVHFRFGGPLSGKMRGFYRSTYALPDGTRRIMGTTQFEATSARRAFPCFDEPALKATFELSMVVPPGRKAISNMPIVSEEDIEGGRRRVRFATTPPMPTYLLAFAVGEFDAIEGTTRDGVRVRVLTTPGKAELGRFALQTAIRGLEWFGEYYGIPYRASIPKLDLLAIPDFEYGAMENWGAITFRETAIFVDPRSSSEPQKRRVAEVVLHELAHQWFGNLVSPQWWSYLWLNESFATFMAYKAADALFPEWRLWEEYLARIASGGKHLDSLRSSHPVEVSVRDPNEVDQIFDAISYNKGGSVLRMLEQAAGEEVFRNGIHRYLERHAYGNATTDDLWRALGEDAGLDVTAMMDGWTRQTGFPVILVGREGATLRLRQERFFLDRDPDRPNGDPTLWDVPISLRDASGGRSRARLSAREGIVETSGEWAKLNAGQSGFYLVGYDDAGWKGLVRAIQGMALDTLDRYGIQEDAYLLMRAGYLSVPGYLELAGAYAKEENHHVWAGIAEGVGTLADIFTGDPNVPRLEDWAGRLFAPVLSRLGWDERADESPEKLLLRATTAGAAVRFGEPSAVSEVKRRFEEARRDPGAVPPNLRSTIFCGAARHGEDAVLEAIIELYERVDLSEVKIQLLHAMGAFRREEPLRRAVDYALSDKVRRQDSLYVFAGVPIETRPTAWELLKERWKVLDERYGKSGLIAHFIASAASGIPSERHAADVELFFRDHPAPFATERIKQTVEAIRARARFRARHRTALADFFGPSG